MFINGDEHYAGITVKLITHIMNVKINAFCAYIVKLITAFFVINVKNQFVLVNLNICMITYSCEKFYRTVISSYIRTIFSFFNLTKLFFDLTFLQE